MSGLPLGEPRDLGFDPDRLQRVFDLLESWARTGKVPGAAVCIGRRGRMLPPQFFGRQRPDADTPLRNDALFLTASITKPVTATAVLLLVERGVVGLEDRVADFVPKFADNGKREVRLRHLLTHTSGLPDMPPDNEALRAAHKPLAAFIDETCRLPLAFAPGSRVSYQSMGIAMLAEVVHQAAGVTLRDFLQKEVFAPLGMADTSLGWQPEKKERIAAVRLPPALQRTDWHWNTPYWLGFGAPWGGMITSPADFARFCQLMQGGGELDGVRLLSPATVRAMTSNQLAVMGQVPEEDRRCRPWGLGWRLNWHDHADTFGDLLSPRSYGHWGATGTLCWVDPEAEVFCILFTTAPLDEQGRVLARVSNAVAAAVV
jgi:CubicO group peptidase (beta-lactamase class C family)